MTSSGYSANLARKKAIVSLPSNKKLGIVFNTMTEPHSATAIKLANQLPLSQDVPSCYGTIQRPATTQKQFTYGNYTNAAFSYPVAEKLIAANYSPVFVQAQAPSDKGLAGFAANFLMGCVSKTVAAPIERVKLLIQTKMRCSRLDVFLNDTRHWRLFL
ncbi:ADP,ATP carrier protein, mitochondrial, partial [Tanacetum coccineum]